MKYEKPGPKIKKAKIWNKTSRSHAIDKPSKTYCRFCGLPDDKTCYFHHCEIPSLKFKYGSGTGCKIDDNLTVWAHYECGTEMSIHPYLKKETWTKETILEWEKKWLYGIIETHLV